MRCNEFNCNCCRAGQSVSRESQLVAAAILATTTDSLKAVQIVDELIEILFGEPKDVPDRME
jgi:hypothetical protein